jgi:hypothetical protein
VTPEEMTAILKLNAIVHEELEHIGRGARATAQKIFRSTYANVRTMDLKEDPSTPRGRTLREAIAIHRTLSPGIRPRVLW